MHIVIALVVGLLLAACARQPVEAPAQSTAPSFRPAEVLLLLESYPFLPKGPMTAEQMAKMKLRPEKFAAPMLVWNYYGGIKGWRLEVLPAGTLVAVDDTGRPWYKLDCSNRLYVPPACPTCPPAAVGAGSAGVGQATGGPPVAGTPAKWGWSPLGKFLWLLLLLALPFLIWGLGRWLERRRRYPRYTPVAGSHPAAGKVHDAPAAGPVGLVPPNAARVEAVAAPLGPGMIGGTRPSGRARVAEQPDPVVAASAATGVAAPAATVSAAAPTVSAPESAPTPVPPVAAPPVSTVGAAIAALAGQGITDVAQIKANPDGSVSFWATARG